MIDWTAMAAEQKVPVASVVSEALQILVLDALFGQPASSMIAFQGGSAIRLIHRGYRYSEDVDLAGPDLDRHAAAGLMRAARGPIERAARQLMGPGVCEWKAPRPEAGRVQAHWFLFTPKDKQAKHRVKIELAHYPVYRPMAASVRSDLDVLSTRPLVRALEPSELLTEKLVALLGRPYLKGRDIFDLWFLQEVLETPLDEALLCTKAADYRLRRDEAAFDQRLQALAGLDLASEMSRFLPERHRRHLGAGGFQALRTRAERIGRQAARVLLAS